jgi:hypothetical protein
VLRFGFLQVDYQVMCFNIKLLKKLNKIVSLWIICILLYVKTNWKGLIGVIWNMEALVYFLKICF